MVGKGVVDRVDSRAKVDRDTKEGRRCRNRNSRCRCSRRGAGVLRVLGQSK